MKILVACEYSGIVREAFKAKGHDAWSCDILPTDIPGNHIQDDVLNHLEGWDMMIAHPPCTYLSKAGARWMHGGGSINQQRLSMAIEAKKFFMCLLNAPINKIAIENPKPLKIVNLPKPSWSIQPYEFGEPYSKKTLLWLKNLPPLMPQILSDHTPFLPSNTGGAKRGQKATYRNISQKESAKTFQGIANAMADQWG